MIHCIQGFLNGVTHGGFSGSINERLLGGSIVEDSLEALLRHAWSPTHLLRMVIANWCSRQLDFSCMRLNDLDTVYTPKYSNPVTNFHLAMHFEKSHIVQYDLLIMEIDKTGRRTIISVSNRSKISNAFQLNSSMPFSGFYFTLECASFFFFPWVYCCMWCTASL